MVIAASVIALLAILLTPILLIRFRKRWVAAAKVLLLLQQVHDRMERYLESSHGRARLQGRYDWDAVVLDATTRRMVRTDFELFFQREEWFRQHNLPYRRGYLFWGNILFAVHEGASFVGHDVNDHNLLLKGRPLIMR